MKKRRTEYQKYEDGRERGRYSQGIRRVQQLGL